MGIEQEKSATKLKILECAAELFAVNGYTETTVRNLAHAVGIKASSLYNHFPSKNAILEFMLDDYSLQNVQGYLYKDIASIIRNDPSPDGILSCMNLTFPQGREVYYLNVLYMLMQEQHRNDTVRAFMSEEFILRIEWNVKAVIDELINQKFMHPDTDADFWIKASSSIVYAFASRRMLGIGDNAPNFTGVDMVGALWNVFDWMLKTCAL